MKLRLFATLGLAAVGLISVGSANAGDYGPQTFDFPDGTTDLGDGSLIGGTIMDGQPNDGTIGVVNNQLQLTLDGVGGTIASFRLPDLGEFNVIDEFTATFDLTIYGAPGTAGSGADGMSFNFGDLPVDGNGGGEGGFTFDGVVTQGIVVAWDTYNNGDDPQSIEAYSNGASIGNNIDTPPFVDGQPSAVSIHWDSNGLDVIYDSVVVFENLSTGDFAPTEFSGFAFSARTGGVSETLSIDNLMIDIAPLNEVVGVPGDANGDGNFDFGDIEAFFLALTDTAAYATQYPGVAISLLDMNSDGNTDFGDIDAFFTALTAG